MGLFKKDKSEKVHDPSNCGTCEKMQKEYDERYMMPIPPRPPRNPIQAGGTTIGGKYTPPIPGGPTHRSLTLIKKTLEKYKKELETQRPDIDKDMQEKLEFVIDDCETLLADIYELIVSKEI